MESQGSLKELEEDVTMENQRDDSVRQCECQPDVAGFEDGGRGHSQGMWEVSRSWKRQETDSSLSLRKGMHPANTLILAQ